MKGLSKSGLGAGFGSLATPLLALAIPVPQVAAIMLPLLLVVDALGVKALFLHRDKALTRRLFPQKLFYQLVYVGMLLTGVKLLWDGLS